ncbi:MAG: sodium:calcium antiporter [Candidatus Bathyarchaeota archaeon]|nr:sodium:calcium antiporter [Candidatus Bathyarchaeota archaeon]MDH5788139.1 sodium:calcium antiporter [Candidatus Bathyarchaeota archaeon]
MLEDPVVQLLILIASLVGLASASHFAIKSVEKLIEITGLSEASAGFIILAVLTSTPEITVAGFSVFQGNPAISIGDILGSNVFNVGAVLGILGILGYLKACCTDLLVELSDILFIATVIPILLVINQYHIFDIPSPIIGIILLATFFINMFLIARKRTPPVKSDNSKVESKVGKGEKGVVGITLLLSITIVAVAARLTVYSAANMALALGVPPILIGAKIVAIGTSLPELTLGLTAVRRGRVQLAIGDLIGSNLTNLTLVLGLVLLTSPFEVDMNIFTEILPFLLMTTIIFWRFIMRGGVSKAGGAILLLTYILFQALIINV